MDYESPRISAPKPRPDISTPMAENRTCQSHMSSWKEETIAPMLTRNGSSQNDVIKETPAFTRVRDYTNKMDLEMPDADHDLT